MAHVILKMKAKRFIHGVSSYKYSSSKAIILYNITVTYKLTVFETDDRVFSFKHGAVETSRL